MAQNGYSFTPGKYQKTTQTDVVPEQEKSNARILESELAFLDEMNQKDDDLVDKTRTEFEQVVSMTSKGADWIKQKGEKDKQEKLRMFLPIWQIFIDFLWNFIFN